MSWTTTDTIGRRPHAVWAAGLVVALAAAVATAHGLYEVAHAAGAPAPIAALYPLTTDGLALVAYAITTRLRGRGASYAWTIVVLAAGLSGLAQAAHLAGEVDAAPTWLRFGVGAGPAAAAAIVAHLLHLLATSNPPYNEASNELDREYSRTTPPSYSVGHPIGTASNKADAAPDGPDDERVDAASGPPYSGASNGLYRPYSRTTPPSYSVGHPIGTASNKADAPHNEAAAAAPDKLDDEPLAAAPNPPYSEASNGLYRPYSRTTPPLYSGGHPTGTPYSAVVDATLDGPGDGLAIAPTSAAEAAPAPLSTDSDEAGPDGDDGGPAAAASPARDRARAAARAHLARHGALPSVTDLVTAADVGRGTAAAALRELRGARAPLHAVPADARNETAR